jgi:hypothetical protein
MRIQMVYRPVEVKNASPNDKDETQLRVSIGRPRIGHTTLVGFV